jgi:hypothetical protein
LPQRRQGVEKIGSRFSLKHPRALRQVSPA